MHVIASLAMLLIMLSALCIWDGRNPPWLTIAGVWESFFIPNENDRKEVDFLSPLCSLIYSYWLI